MTRKKYQVDNTKGPMWEEEQIAHEKKLQKQYEEYCKQIYEKTLTFDVKHFEQLYDMFEDLKTNLISITILENCKFQDFADFMENPTYFNVEEDNVNYEYEMWNDDYGKEVKSHFKAMKMFKLTKERNVTIEQFKRFCFTYHYRKEIGKVTIIPREISSGSWFYD